MKETALFGFSYPEETDAPDGAKQIKEAVEDVEALLSTIEKLLGTVAVPAAPEAGNLIIVNGTSDPVYKAATGDVTNNSAGVFTIGEKKVATSMIQELAVTAARLAAEAVETGKIKGEAVTEAKLAALAVATGKLANEAVTTGKIGALAVTEAKLAAESVATSKIANLAVTEAKLADGAASSRKFKPTSGLLTSGAIEQKLTEAYVAVAGTELKINLPVKSFIQTWEFATFSGPTTAAVIGFLALYVDGAIDEAHGALPFAQGEEHTGSGTGAGGGRLNLSNSHRVELAAGEHTLQLRAKRQGTLEELAKILAAGFSYLVSAA